jgi:uncharacterized protein (TIGR02266 family)
MGAAAGKRRAKLRSRRTDVNVEFDSIEAFLSEYVSNISSSGAFIRTRKPLPVGSLLNLRFTILADDPEVLEGTGEVVRVSERPRGMGVAFIGLDERSKELIEKLLSGPRPRRRRGP